jgi:hypothetical protein
MTFSPQKKPIRNIPSLRYGMNTQQESDEIQDFEMADCENFSIEEDAVKSAPGFVRYDTKLDTGPVWGIYEFIKSDGTHTLIRQIAGKLQYDANGAGGWADCTLPTVGSPAATVILTQIQPTFASLNDILIFSNGTDGVMSSADGITWTIRPTLPKGRIVFNNGYNRLLFCNTPEAHSIIWWTEINDPLTVRASSWQYIDPNNGQDILGIGKLPNGAMIIFKNKSYYSVDDITLGMATVTYLGDFYLASHHTIKTTENSIIAAGIDGIYEFGGGIMNKISGRINWTGRNAITRFDLMTAVYLDSKYYLSMPDATVAQTYNSQEYVVYRNIRRGDPVQPYAITRNRRYWGCYGIEERVSGAGKIFRLHVGESKDFTLGSPAVTASKNNYVNYQRNTGVTQGLNGEAQESFFITKFFTDDVPYFVKRYKKVFLDMKISDDVTVTLGYRFSPNGAFTEVAQDFSVGNIDMILEDGLTRGFIEGFNFKSPDYGSENTFFSIENTGKPRGIQLRISVNDADNVTALGLAYQFKVKQKFK